MKKLVVLFSVLVLQGLNSFGQTNAAPPASAAVPRVETPVAKTPPVQTPAVVTTPPAVAPTETTDASVGQSVVLRQNKHTGGKLKGIQADKNFGASMHEIFRSDNDQMGDNSIRDAVVVIYPTGH